MQNDEFTMTEEVDGDTVRFIAKGRITSFSAGSLEFTISEAIKKGMSNIIVNMMQVAFLSSAGIRVLLMFFKKAKEAGGSFYVESPSENVINVLGMTALDEMLLKPEA